MRRRVPVPRSGGLILSYTCSARCMHCMYGSSPRWSADWISEERLAQLLSRLARTIEPSPLGPETISLNHGLHFTGGEPFLKFDLLVRAVELADELGVASTFVETNCFWCSSDETTREQLELLKASGLGGILISVNPFYLQYVPFERTERCVRLSLEVFGRNTLVYQVEYFRRFLQWGLRDRVSFEEYLELERAPLFMRNVEFFLMGRAPYAVGDKLAHLLPRSSAEAVARGGCVPSFAREWHNHFDNYGNYVPGYCGGISYGDLAELETLTERGFEPSERPVLSLLMDEDLLGLLQLGRDHGYEPLAEGYLSRCHLCVDLRKHLITAGDFPELEPREFYEHLGG